MPTEATATNRLRSFVRGHLQVIDTEIETAAVFFHEWTHLSEAARRHVIGRRDAYQAHLRRIIESGASTGEFRVTDVEIATLLTLSSLNWSYQWFDPHGRLPLEQLTKQYTDYVLGALGAGRGANSG